MKSLSTLRYTLLLIYFLIKGTPLIKNTKGKLRLQIKIMISAANLLINRMQNDKCDLFNNPPKLSKLDWLVLFCQCILSK